MGKKEIRSDAAAAPDGGYSQAIEFGGMVFVSGQGPLHPETGEVMGETIEEQTVHTLNNIRRILESAELGLDDVVKTTVHVSDMKLFEAFDKTYQDQFSKPYPARLTVASGLLGILVEIDAIAMRAM